MSRDARAATIRPTATLTGVEASLTLHHPMLWFLIFAIAVFSLYFWREYSVQRRELEAPDAPQRSGERFIGQVLTLERGIRGGRATVRLGQRNWQIRGPELDPGSKVRVTGVDGSVLLVDRLPG